MRSRLPASRLLLPVAAAGVLLAACGGGRREEPAPPPAGPAGERPGGAAAETAALQLERCRADLDARRDVLIVFDRDLEELKADREAALAELAECREQAAEARVEADRLKCYLEGRTLNPATLRCEGAVLHQVDITTP